MTTLQIIGKRPDDIPNNWIILNAPRPLYGNKEWTGEFEHGIFYVALDPNDDYVYDMWMKSNESLDAWICEYQTKEDAIKMALDYYNEKYPEDSETINDLPERELLRTFYRISEEMNKA